MVGLKVYAITFKTTVKLSAELHGNVCETFNHSSGFSFVITDFI